MNQELHPKAVHLVDKPKDLDENGFVPDCAVTDNTILLKGYFELWTGQLESEIRESITEILKQRFPFVRPDHFDFVKQERKKVTTPIVRKSLEWNYKLLEFGGLHSADALLEGDSLPEHSNTVLCESLVQIIDILGKKLTGKRKNLEVDEDDIVEDAVAY